MARPREFDMDDVLQKAMRVFWRRGYVGTAMSDIYEATGLKPGSLYAAFRDKDGLFRMALERYSRNLRAALPDDLKGLAAIEACLAGQARLAIDDVDRAGCLIVNTLAERELHSPATQAMAQGRLQEIRDFLLRNLIAAVQAGELLEDARVDRHADALVGAVLAIMTLGRAAADGEMIENVAAAALDALPRTRAADLASPAPAAQH